jgi:hypothetical protein
MTDEWTDWKLNESPAGDWNVYKAKRKSNGSGWDYQQAQYSKQTHPR